MDHILKPSLGSKSRQVSYVAVLVKSRKTMFRDEFRALLVELCPLCKRIHCCPWC